MKAPSAINDPAYWRQRADDAREMADRLTDPAVRQALHEVAASYEQLAKLAEDRLLQKG